MGWAGCEMCGILEGNCIRMYLCKCEREWIVYRRGGLGDWCRKDGRLVFHTIPLTAFCTICVLLVLILSTYSNMLAFCLSSNWYIMVSMAM